MTHSEIYLAALTLKKSLTLPLLISPLKNFHSNPTMSHPARPPDLPALNKLIEACDQFLEEHDSVLEGSPCEIYNDVTNALGLSDEKEIPVPAPLAFIVRLPTVDASELPEDRRDCGIYLQPLHSANESKNSSDHLKLEVTIKLPCGHDCLGIRCLWEWFTPFRGLNHNTCPMCRAVCFEGFPNRTRSKECKHA